MASDTPTELTRRRLLAGLGVVGAASAVGGAGTVAFLSDTESSTGNSIQAGTVDLILGGDDGVSTTFSAANLAPGDSGWATADIANQGSIDGTVSVTIDSVTESGGATVDSEDQDGGADDGSALLDELSLEIGFDPDYGSDTDLEDGDEVDAVSANLSASPEYDAGTTHPTSFTLAGGVSGTSTMYVEWALDADAPNTVQGDEVTVDLTVTLEQQP